MRHLRSILYSLVLAPAAWVLTGVGLTGDLTARGRDGFAVESFTGLLLLLLAGAAYGILVLGPISPAGPLLAGVVYLAIGIWALMSPSAYADLWPSSVAKDGFDLSRPGYGLAALLAVPLICTALSARRWAKYEPPVLPLIGQIGRARGAAVAQGTPLAVVQTTVIPTAQPFPGLDPDPTTVLRFPTSQPATALPDDPTAPLPGPATLPALDATPTDEVPTPAASHASDAAPADEEPTEAVEPPANEEPTEAVEPSEAEQPTAAVEAAGDEDPAATVEPAQGDDPTEAVEPAAVGESVTEASESEPGDESSEADDLEAEADGTDVIQLPVGDAAERTQVVRLPVGDGGERTQVVRLPVGDAADRTQVVRLPLGDSAEILQLPVGDADSRTQVVPFPSPDPDEKTQVIKLHKPSTGENTTQVLQFPVRSPGAEPGHRTRDLSTRATRDVGGDETQVIRLADKTVDDEKTQVIRPALVTRPGNRSDVLTFPHTANPETPVSIAEAEAPNFADDPTSPLIPPAPTTDEEAAQDTQRSMTVLNMERPQDELADDPTRPLEIPAQRQPQDD